MNFVEAISSGFRQYANFRGRSLRSEYWYWVLFVFLGLLIATIVDAFTTVFPFNLVFVLVTFLPSLVVSVRRLHDIDRSGWWSLLALVPIIGSIVLLIWLSREGTPGENRYDGESVRLCPQCGTENNLESEFCINCGLSLAVAPQVGGRIVTRARFLTPVVGLIVGLVFAVILLQAAILPPGFSSVRENAFDDQPQIVLFWPFSSDLISFRSRTTVASDLWPRLSFTLEIVIIGGGLAVLLAWGFGLVLGRDHPRLAAVRMSVAFLAAIPVFWLAVLVLMVLERYPVWMPSLRFVHFWDDPWGSIATILWPILVVGISSGFLIALQMRSQEGASPMMILAHAFGLVLRHAGMLLSGVIVFEILFTIPGLGRVLLEAVFVRDVPMLGATAAIIVWLALWSRFFGNLLLAKLDRSPPVRTEAMRGTESGIALAIGGGVTIGLLALLFLAPFVMWQDPMQIDPSSALDGPSIGHWLGTDNFGRDVLSRVFHGGRTAAAIGLPLTLMALLAGIPMIIARVVLERARAQALMYGIEGVLEGLVAVPWFLTAFLIQSKVGVGWPFLALAVVLLPRALRVGWALGADERLEVMPVAYAVLRLGALFLAATVAMSTALGFMDLGVPSAQANLGEMLSLGRYSIGAPGLSFFPGFAATLIIATWLAVPTLFSRSGPVYRAVGWVHIMS